MILPQNYKALNKLLLFMALATSNVLTAQSPELINYQAVARHGITGVEVVNRDLYLQVLIRRGGPGGDIVYQEVHDNVTTDAFGLFSLKIGGGAAVSGNFGQINWGSHSHWLDVACDMGNGLQPFGAMQFVSVPYALHAETATHVDDADADPENELIDEVAFNSENYTLTIQEGARTHTTDLSALIGAGDGAAIESVVFNPNNSQLVINEGGESFNVNLSPLINDADADPSNELIHEVIFDSETFQLALHEAEQWHTVDLSALNNAGSGDIDDMSFNSGTSQLSINQGGNIFSVNLNALINDADSDPANELITGTEFDPVSAELKISEGPNTHFIDLSALTQDADSDPENELIHEVLFDDQTFQLSIHEASNWHSVDLSALHNTEISEETLIQGIGFNNGNGQLTITQGSMDYGVNLSALRNDADADPTNELIAPGSFTISPEGVLQLTEAGITHQVNITPALSAVGAGWVVNAVQNVVHNQTSRIGIGTDTPSARLESRGPAGGLNRIAQMSRTDGTSLWHVDNNTVTTTATAQCHIEGQLRYRPTVLTSHFDSFLNYGVQPQDHYIVTRMLNTWSDVTRTIFLPTPVGNEGRVITVVNANPNDVARTLNIACVLCTINYSLFPLSITADGFTTVTFMSLGADGWIVTSYSEYN